MRIISSILSVQIDAQFPPIVCIDFKLSTHLSLGSSVLPAGNCKQFLCHLLLFTCKSWEIDIV